MSDDLVRRLRDQNGGWASDEALAAANRIEALERAVRYLAQQAFDEREELEDKLAKAVRFLNGLDRHGVYTTDELEYLLEELKWQDDEHNHQGQTPYWLDSYCRPNKTKGSTE